MEILNFTPFIRYHSSGSVEERDSPSEEYEYMNKQTCLLPPSPRRPSELPKDSAPNRRRSCGTQLCPAGGAAAQPRRHSAYPDCRAVEPPRVRVMLDSDGNSPSSTTDDESGEDGRRQSRESEGVEYEYMDLCSGGGSRSGSAGSKRDVETIGAASAERDGGMEVEEEEEDGGNEQQDHEDYHYVNKQPRLRPMLRGRGGLTVQGPGGGAAGGIGEVYEYEEMDSLVAPPGGGDRGEYENLAGGEGDGGVAAASEEARRSSVGYLKLHAGVGESGDHSFDNPDYWHSRLFLKADAVRT